MEIVQRLCVLFDIPKSNMDEVLSDKRLKTVNCAAMAYVVFARAYSSHKSSDALTGKQIESLILAALRSSQHRRSLSERSDG